MAAVAGDQVGFVFGRRVGPSLFRRPDARFFRRHNLELARDYFTRHGPRTVVLARFIPLVRTFTPVVAGVAGMPWRTFFVYNVVGGVLWGAGAVLAGWALGQLGEGEQWLIPVAAVIFAVSFVPVVAELVRLRRAPLPEGQPDGVVEAQGLEGDE